MAVPSISKRILEFINNQDPLVGVTNLQVLAAVGRYIGITNASSYARKVKQWYARKNKSGVIREYTLDELVTFGRSLTVNRALDSLIKTGKIRKIRRGIYAPLLAPTPTEPSTTELSMVEMTEPAPDIPF